MLNIDNADDNLVIIEYTGIPFLDSMICIYQLALGDFQYDGFIKSKYDFLLWGAFVLCTFLMIVVFMNMIIAIMGNTFGEVMEKRYETALNENISLIYDHIWLLDLKEEFKDLKYIIRIIPDIPVKNHGVDTSDLINELELKLIKKQDKNHKSMQKKIELFEKNVRVMLKN
jgi:hypothetical protein